MTVASDRRQLWLDAREMLATYRERMPRPLDDEESFAAFVRQKTLTAPLLVSVALVFISLFPVLSFCRPIVAGILPLPKGTGSMLQQ